MKYILPFLFLAFLLDACQSEQKIDMQSGSQLQVSAKGLSYTEIDVLVNEKKDRLRVFDFGDKIALRINNVKGMKRIAGKCYPGLRMIVLNQQKDTLLNFEDLFEGEEGIKEDPLALIAQLKAAEPLYSGQIYTMLVHIWDKNGKAEMDMKMDFSLKPNPHVKVKKRDLSYNEIYIVNPNTDEIIQNTFADSTRMVFNIEGLKGFTAKEDKIFPGLSVEVLDEKGEVVFESPNILQAYYESGIDFMAVNERIYFSLDERYTTPYKKLKIHAVLFDKLSDANLILDVDLSQQ